MALNKLKKFVTEEVMDEVCEDEYYDAEKVTIPGGGKMILLEPRAYSESQQIADHLKKKNTVVVEAKEDDFSSKIFFLYGFDRTETCKLPGMVYCSSPHSG